VAPESNNQNYDNYHYIDQRGIPINFNGIHKNNINIESYQRMQAEQ